MADCVVIDIAKFCIQCRDAMGVVGSFVYVGESPVTGRRLSENYADTVDLFIWMTESGWRLHDRLSFDCYRVGFAQ